jgi:hypothetical protein
MISDSVVAVVDAPSTYFMMERIIDSKSRTRYFVEEPYVNCFPVGFLAEHGIEIFGINTQVYLRCMLAIPALLVVTFHEFTNVSVYGALPLTMFHFVLKAARLTPDGDNNCLIVSEHLIMSRAIRNELLRSYGSSSVYISRNSYVTFQHYSAERQLNYDVFCASGKHAVDLYYKKEAITKNFFITGSYDANRDLSEDIMRESRRADIDSYKGGETLVVFLSPGICDETYSSELRLMQLAKSVSELPGVRVIVRMKPGGRAHGYGAFYENIFEGNSKAWLTGGEFDLFDFVGIGDLFVTSISTSACDISLRGGDVLFVDFMRTPDLYLPWVKVPEVVVSQEDALLRITDWVSNCDEHELKKAHMKFCRDFSKYVGYVNDSYSEYRSELVKCIRPWLDRRKPLPVFEV